MTYEEISVKMDKVAQQLTSSPPQLEHKKMKIELRELANYLVTEAEDALNDDNFEKVKCAMILATSQILIIKDGNENDVSKNQNKLLFR